MSKIIIATVALTQDAYTVVARYVGGTGTREEIDAAIAGQIREDIGAVRLGAHDQESLLASYLDDSEHGPTIDGWRDYVQAVIGASGPIIEIPL